MNKTKNKELQSSDQTVAKSKKKLRVKMPSRKNRAPSCSSSSSNASSPPSDSSGLNRSQRNLAEKQRRDKLNGYISELASLVPLVSYSSKKLDKTSVLRLTAAHLRLHQSSLNRRNDESKVSWIPSNLRTDDLNELLKAIEGFLVVTTTSGKVLFASRLVENYLGHQDIELIGHSIFYFIHPDDLCQVKSEWKKINNLMSHEQGDNSNDKNSIRCSFRVRMREKCQPRSEVVNYKLMRFTCSYTKDDHCAKSKPSTVSHRSRLPISELDNGVLKLFIQPINLNPFDDLSLSEAFQDEYVTQHVASGKIIFADHRISTITGHLPHEVIGMVAYKYIFREDVPVAQFAQKLMFSSSNGTGMIVYRLMSRDGNAVYLKSIGHLQYDKASTKISHFVCINKLLNPKEGKEELRKFKERYSPRISELCGFTSEQLIAMFTEKSPLVANKPKTLEELQPSLPIMYEAETFQEGCNIPSPNLPLQIPNDVEISQRTYSSDTISVQDLEIPQVSSSYPCNGSGTEWQNVRDGQMQTPPSGIDNFHSNCLPFVSVLDNQCEIAHNRSISRPASLSTSLPLFRTDLSNIRHLNGQKRAYNILANPETICPELPLKAKYVKYDNDSETKDKILSAFAAVENPCQSAYESNYLPIEENNIFLPTLTSRLNEPNIIQTRSVVDLLPIDSVFPLTKVAHLNGETNQWISSALEDLKPDRKNGLAFVQELSDINNKGSIHDYVP